MDKKIVSLVTGAFLVLTGITAFTVYKYVITLQEKSGLEIELSNLQQGITQVEHMRDNLIEDLARAKEYEQKLLLENTGLQAQIKDDKLKFSMLETAISEAQGQVDTLQEQLSIARQENTALVAQLDGLKTQLLSVSQQRDKMQATLNSIDALKRAIKDLRHRMRAARKASMIRVVDNEKNSLKRLLWATRDLL